jgi:3'-5' exoribonuclease
MRASGLEEELGLHLKHLIVSHHGSREFGSPVLPATAEAVALHYADNIDAKFNQVREALEGTAPGEEAWSNYVPGLDRQTLLAGALCHDLGKIWELGGGLVAEYTSPGRLLGHIALGLEKLEPLMRASGLEEELGLHLKHLILSHHGSREFGSPVLPATAEALALHYADNIDAKFNQVREALEGTAPGEEAWSHYGPGLERFLFQALPSPGALDAGRAGSAEREGGGEPEGNKAGIRKGTQEDQCLLLLKE